MNSPLFTPLKLRDITFKNRIFVSPMCQYSATDGLPNHWHLVHLGSRAVGGAALVMAEATGVNPQGRISPGDTGIWSEAHTNAFKPIAQFIKDQNSIPAIQLAHAGRKASTQRPWEGGKSLSPQAGAWPTVAPSAIRFDKDYHTPAALTPPQIESLVADFVAATRRAQQAGFEVIELHMAHGYLLHEFLSPITNHRTDSFGGSFENRIRLPLQITHAVRAAWPDNLPLFVRISATDWASEGTESWDLPQSIEFARHLKSAGADLIDCSSGGLIPHVKIPVTPGYQVPFAQAIKHQAHIPTGAVGMITDPYQANQIIEDQNADAVLLARQLLKDPYWPLHAAQSLHTEVKWPVQYERAK